MIIPDINLLIYAYNADAPDHLKARVWWERLMNSRVPVGLPWAVVLGFIRLMTSRNVLINPLPWSQALEHVRSWLQQPAVEVLNPGPNHLQLLEELFEAAASAGKLTTDVHLASLAIEYKGELHSNDADFERFPNLLCKNPLRD